MTTIGFSNKVTNGVKDLGLQLSIYGLAVMDENYAWRN